jgi:hypothetical protein
LFVRLTFFWNSIFLKERLFERTYENSAFRTNGIRKKKMNFERTLFEQTTSSRFGQCLSTSFLFILLFSVSLRPFLYLFFIFVCFLNNFSLFFIRYLFLSLLMFFFPLLSTDSCYVGASFRFLSVNLILAFRSFSTIRFIFLLSFWLSQICSLYLSIHSVTIRLSSLLLLTCLSVSSSFSSS